MKTTPHRLKEVNVVLFEGEETVTVKALIFFALENGACEGDRGSEEAVIWTSCNNGVLQMPTRLTALRQYEHMKNVFVNARDWVHVQDIQKAA